MRAVDCLQRYILWGWPPGDLNLLLHERIDDVTFRRAVDLLDAGDAAALRTHLNEHPNLVFQRVVFEDMNYFRNPTLLEFAAENPVRHGTLPADVVQAAKVILDAGAKQDRSAVNNTLALVSSGRVTRECGVQVRLVDLLCDYGADPNEAMPAALVHAEWEAVNALIRRGAEVDLSVAAALGRVQDVRRLLASADSENRHRALALASQFGHTEIVCLLLEAGEDPNRYNPAGYHGHSMPLHQAALAGHYEAVRLLVERGARLDAKDTIWQATPADWARHAERPQIEEYLLKQQEAREALSTPSDEKIAG